jgi:3-dehydroquinate dehydratase II
MKLKVLILNGPNLNLLGTRQPEIYGHGTLLDIENAALAKATALDFALDFRQSNSEGELVTWIQQGRTTCAGIIINPAAYSHTSVAIMDALLACPIPVIEVHLANIFKREAFRHHSYVSSAVQAMICGLGAQGYLLALDAMFSLLNRAAPVRDAPANRCS